jgi:hypothetical protein
MPKDLEKPFLYLKPVEPPAGLFDKIILAIKGEQELRQTRRLLFSFLFLLVVSLIATPFSFARLVNQIKISGISYLISTAVSDFGTFLVVWKDFILAILESLPITEIITFSISLGICLFTLRLFLYRKKLLVQYLFNNLRFS